MRQEKLNGLSDTEVIMNREKYGSNDIKVNNSNSFFCLLLESLGDPIIKILLTLIVHCVKRNSQTKTCVRKCASNSNDKLLNCGPDGGGGGSRRQNSDPRR